MFTVSRIAIACTITALSAGCATPKIPGTNVLDTPENRTILSIVHTYHQAMEARDAEAILALISPDYFEDNGNTDRKDDYDKAGLGMALRAEFAHTEKIQLDMKVESIKIEEQRAYAFIHYSLRARSEFPSGLKWKTNSDRSRLEFEKIGEDWMIVSGL